ncbi:MAG TPA: ABC transporter permease [Candidatus Thermoplasmatota archaeon]|nr:ABC transporter permease [Candidatus Thermoplasmatota archaeon]
MDSRCSSGHWGSYSSAAWRRSRRKGGRCITTEASKRASAWARTFGATFKTSLTQQIRAYTLSGWTVSAILMPVFLFAGAWVALRFLGQGDAPSRFFDLTGYPSYLAFVVLGVAFNGLAMGALEDGGNAVYEEESNGTWDLLSLAPFNRFVWMFAKTLASLLTGFVDFFAVLLLGALVFRVRPTIGGLAIAILGILLTVLALQGLGFLMAALGLLWKQPYAIAFLLSPAVILLSGMMFPVKALPGWVQPLSSAIPLTHGLHIVRDAILLDRGLVDLLPAFGWLLLTGAILMAIGFAAFQLMETRARQLGVLGRY